VNPDGTSRPPEALEEQPLQVRTRFGLSQTQMCRALDLAEDYSAVSQYELERREPPLPILLCYAELANVYVDVLIDDRLDLPQKLPARAKHAGVKRGPRR
jgi:transcriptional regulator with XRE-family HTH domain